MRLLITSGGTREPIDGVRYITNFSTGSTGAFLADAFSDLGYSVTHLRAKESVISRRAARSLAFDTFSDLAENLDVLLRNEKFDVVLHAAAVSDFSISKIRLNGKLLDPSEAGKISSEASVELLLKNNPKLINSLKELSLNKAIKIVGFKLTDTLDNHERWEAVKKLTYNPHIDLVVHNDLSEILPSLNQHKCQIYKQGKCLIQTHTKAELASALLGLF